MGGAGDGAERRRTRWQLLGVPYTSMREAGGIDRSIGALREDGLAEALAAHGVADGGDLDLAAPSGRRGASGLLNEAALGRLCIATRQAVIAAHAGGRTPLLVGGDCPVILGALAALGADGSRPGLVMIDGHEDAWPPQLSPTGEASDSELGIALGRVGERLPDPLARWVPLLDPTSVALIGPRDAEEIADGGVGSLRGELAYFADDAEVLAAGPAAVGARALEQIAADRLWLHIDLDVLGSSALAAVDYPQPGGLDWAALCEVVATACADPRVAGASIVIYNPDLDPDRSGARAIVEFVTRLVAAGRAFGDP